MAKTKKEIEVPAVEETVEVPVEVEAKKKFDLKKIGKTTLKWVCWIALGGLAVLAVGAAFGAIADDSDETAIDAGDGTDTSLPAEETNSSGDSESAGE